MVVTETTAAREYEASGDPEHVAYAADFVWRCSCGRSSSFITTRPKAEYGAENHATYCVGDGDVTLDVVR